MIAKVDEVLEAALALPADDQRVLVEALLASTDPPNSHSLHPSWAAEIRRRSEAYDAGQTQTLTWDEVKEQASRRLMKND